MSDRTPVEAAGTASPAPGSTRPAPTPWLRSGVVGIALAALVTVIVLAFSWPSVTSEPRGIRVAVAGPEQAVTQLEQALSAKADSPLDLSTVKDRATAVTEIEQREVYGAIVLGPKPEVLTASAASPAVSQLLTAMSAQLQAQLAQQAAANGTPAPTVTTTDVVPLLDADPRGAGIVAAAFPLVIGGMLGGIAISLSVHGARRRALALLVYSAVAGLAVAGVMQGWFGVLAGNYLANAGAFALSLLAIGATIVGAATLVGRVGIAIGPILFLLVANPISSAAAPKEFLPGSWGEAGQWFPPGAGATLIRNLSYFPDASSTFPWLVLIVWAAGGLLLTTFAGLLHRSRARRA
ncbi:MAG: hypothetical protein J0H64_04755 [Actinobacteria bacterium]|nr:hypothetical protein [Actinomycetota bacterium]